MISIDQDKCIRCRRCEAVCPAMVIEKVDGRMEVVHKKTCINCYHCVAVCPEDAVTCSEYALDAFPVIGNKKPASPAATRNLLTQRRSVREFKNKPVPRKLLEELVEIALQAPTGHNARGVHLTVITDREVINKVDRRITHAFDTLASVLENPVAETLVKTLAGKDKLDMVVDQKNALRRFVQAGDPRALHVFRAAPVLVLAHTGPDNLTGRDDSVIALSHMMMAANANGLGATWIGYIVGAAKVVPTFKKTLGVPMRHSLDASMILGWPKFQYKRTIPREVRHVKWIEPRA